MVYIHNHDKKAVCDYCTSIIGRDQGGPKGQTQADQGKEQTGIIYYYNS